MKKVLWLCTTFLLFLFPLLGQNSRQNQKFLKLSQSDFYLLPAEEDGAYHLYIRKKYGLESVMLVESNKDPTGKKTNYAYRALEYNPVNGDEVRILDGKVLNSKYAKYSLIDSSAEKNAAFGQAFHIYIPKKIVFGYPWSRNGQVEIGKDFTLNIRSFGKKFADYSGSFQDNSFTISLEEGKIPLAPQPSVETYTYDDEDYEDEEEISEPVSSPSIQKIELTPYQPESYSDYEPEYDYYDDEASAADQDTSEYEDYDIPADSSYLITEDNDSEAYQAVQIVDNTDLDSPSAKPFDEDSSRYNLNYKKSEKKVKSDEDDEAVAQDPYKESMQGVDQDALEALINSVPKAQTSQISEKDKQTQTVNKINPFGKDYFLSYDGIMFIYLEGSRKIPDLYVSETEINQKSYERIMSSNPSQHSGSDLPVDSISYYEAIYFCNKLSLREGRTPCYALKGETDVRKWGSIPKARSSLWASITCNFDADGYRLLTVEEWEFFANGGVKRQSGNYAGSREIDSVAWYLDNSGESSAPCGLKEKNPCGLRDMCGNLSEYVYGPSGDKEKTCALKGGNFSSEEKDCQTKTTCATDPWLAEPTNGLRICRKVD